ncbi:vWA domain-containing protein [Arenicella xantha]|uniref:von Willebrand factor type A domain-containing protein n=1 Tax=Arenicella xantha TaxID=644221 RepID=A0A395JIE9_9GAMM|nr:VWA domain-containing protein [Arenicella xantha]RBP48400.1 von Willebrand factor type A domain-containing protein [Arenicella xantha]
MKSKCLIVIGVWAVIGFSSAMAQESRVVFILDGSNSMWGQVDGKAKIAIAQEVLGDVTTQLPKDTAIGLAAYGHRSKDDCGDIEMLLPIKQRQPSEFATTVASVVPKGKTPIEGALEFVAGQLGSSGAKTHLVLVSDGVESCGGDPCAAAKAMHQANASMSIHLVGFGVNKKERQQLQCIATEGGGMYADAQSAADLTKALAAVTENVAKNINESAPVIPPIDTSGPNWSLQSEDQTFNGKLFKHFTLDGNHMIHLINRDAVNFAFAYEGEDSGQRKVMYATFADGRGPICRRVGPIEDFTVSFMPAEPGWIAGSFNGILGCPDYSAMPVEGSFYVKAAEE